MKEEPRHRLQKARAAAGYNSPTDAANSIREINKNTLISHENGNRPISRQAAAKYGRLFGVDPGWLLFQEEPSETIRCAGSDRLKNVFAHLANAPDFIQDRVLSYAEFELKLPQSLEMAAKPPS